MQLKFKRHQQVILKSSPRDEDTEWYSDEKVTIKKGTKAKVNVILPNGRYHVEIFDDNGETLAYAAMDEEQLEADS